MLAAFILTSSISLASSTCALCSDLGGLTVTPKGFSKMAVMILKAEMPGIIQDLKTERVDAHRKGFKLLPKKSELFQCEPKILTEALCKNIDCLDLNSSQMIHQKKFDVINSSSCKPIEILNSKGELEYRATESHLKNFWITDLEISFAAEPLCDLQSCSVDIKIPKLVFRGDFDLSTIESVKLVGSQWTSKIKTKFQNLPISVNYSEPLLAQLKFDLSPHGEFSGFIVPSNDTRVSIDSTKIKASFDKSQLEGLSFADAERLELYLNVLLSGGLVKTVIDTELNSKRKELLEKLASITKKLPQIINRALKVPTMASDLKDISNRNKLKDELDFFKACLVDDRIKDPSHCKKQFDLKQKELIQLNDKISKTFSAKELSLRVSEASTQDGKPVFVLKAFGEEKECFDFPLYEVKFSSSRADVRTELSLKALQHYLTQNHQMVMNCRKGSGPCNKELAELYPFLNSPTPSISYHAATKSYLIQGVIADPLGGEHILKSYIKTSMCRQGKIAVPCLIPMKWESQATGWISSGVGFFNDIAEIVSARARPMFYKVNRAQLEIPNAKIIKSFIDESTHNLVFEWELHSR
jgi:hypothetical protein